MLRMEYVPPTLDALIHRTQDLINKYTRGNKERIRLIHILEALASFLNNLKSIKLEDSDTYLYNADKLRKIGIGAYIFCALSIGKNSNSTLYDILLETLEMDENKNLGDQGTLIHLEKFYTFLTKKNHWVDEEGKSFAYYLGDRGLDIPRLKNEVDSVVSGLLSDLHQHILTLSKIVRPTNTTLAQNISHLQDDYLKAKADQENYRLKSCLSWLTPEIKPNNERLFIIQLGTLGSALLPYIYKNIKNADKCDPEILNLHQRIMMGYLLFVIHSINNSRVSSWWNYSQLLKLAYKALHILEINDPHSFMNKQTQEVCLTAFESFINRDDVKAEIESHGKESFGEKNQLQYIHSKVRTLAQELKDINDHFQQENENNASSSYPATIRLSELMSLLADPLCPLTCGGGAFLGYMVSKTIEATYVTALVSNSLNAAGSLFSGTSGSILQLVGVPFAANFMVEAGSIVGFAFMTHYIFKASLYLTGGAIGAFIIDIPAHEVEKCYHLLKQLLSNHDVLDAEYHFVDSLRKFPKERYGSYPSDWERVQLIPVETLKELRAGLDENHASELDIDDLVGLDNDLEQINQGLSKIRQDFIPKDNNDQARNGFQFGNF